MQLYISRSRNIDLPTEQVFAFLADLENYPKWNPWSCFDPQIETKVTGQASQQSYYWDGSVVGSGKLSEISRLENRRIDYQLEFYKPMKIVAKVSYQIESTGENSCSLSWEMQQNLRFPFSLFSRWIEYSIGTDFELGLLRLEALLVRNQVWPRIEILNNLQPIDVPSTQYLAQSYRGKISEIPAAAAAAFSRQAQLLQIESGKYSQCFTPSFKGSPTRNHCKLEFATEIPAGRDLSELSSSGMAVKQRPALRCLALRIEADNFDAVRYIWNRIFSLHKGLNLKRDKRFVPFERYPEPADSQVRIVDICLPVK